MVTSKRTRRARRHDEPTEPVSPAPEDLPDPRDALPFDPIDSADTTEQAAAREDAASTGPERSPINPKVLRTKVCDWEVRKVIVAGRRRRRQLQAHEELYKIGPMLTERDCSNICGPGEFYVTWYTERVNRETGAKRRVTYDHASFTVNDGTKPAASNAAPASTANDATTEPTVTAALDRIIPAEMTRTEQILFSFLDTEKVRYDRLATLVEKVSDANANAMNKASESASATLASVTLMVKTFHEQSAAEIRQRADMAASMIAMQERMAANALVNNVLVPVALRAVNRFLPETPGAGGGAGNPLDKLDAAMGSLKKIEAAAEKLDSIESELSGLRQLKAIMPVVAERMGIALPPSEEATKPADALAATPADAAQAPEVVTPVSGDPDDHVPV